MSAVFARGHWRRRDPLDGLSFPMRWALADAAVSPLALASEAAEGEAPSAGARAAGRYNGAHAPATVHALAERGLLILSCGRDGRERRFRLTPAGRYCVAEIRRRAAARIVIGS